MPILPSDVKKAIDLRQRDPTRQGSIDELAAASSPAAPSKSTSRASLAELRARCDAKRASIESVASCCGRGRMRA